MSARWSLARTTAKPVTVDRDVWQAEKTLITDGDSGMHRAAAIAYAREGADVAINYLPAEETDAGEVADLIKKEGRICVPIPRDLREEAFCQRRVSEAVQGLGELDIVVSNAGLQQSHESIADISTEQFDWTMKTNIYAPFWIFKAALPHLQPDFVEYRQTPTWYEIVGVVAGIRTTNLAEVPKPEFFVPYEQAPYWPQVVILRVTGEPRAYVNSVRSVVAGLNRNCRLWQRT